MVEIKFVFLQIVMDSIFAVLAFLGFICGIHYGTELVGLHFWFVEFTLGIIGLSLMISVFVLVKPWVTFLFKHGAIYASSTECTSVFRSIAGVFENFGSTAKVIVFNKVIRNVLECTKNDLIKASKSLGFDGLHSILRMQGVREGTEGESTESSSEVANYLAGIVNSPLGRLGKHVISIAFDYVDECILGYCYTHVSEDNGMLKCAAQAFTIFIKNSLAICEKILVMISLHLVVRTIYWIAFVAFSLKYFSLTLMNILVLFVVGQLILFVINDAVLEPMLMYVIINQFNEYDWDDSLNADMQSIASENSAFKNVLNRCGINEESEAEASEDDEVGEVDEVENTESEVHNEAESTEGD